MKRIFCLMCRYLKSNNAPALYDRSFDVHIEKFRSQGFFVMRCIVPVPAVVDVLIAKCKF